MADDTSYTIADLARLTGLNVRTIRYYLAQGLIPASGESGPGAHYGQGHLDRLRLTKRLQRQHLPLAEIRGRLASLSDDAVAGVLSESEPQQGSPGTSALDYVRGVLGQAPASAMPPALPVAARPLALRAGIAARIAPKAQPSVDRSEAIVLPSIAEARPAYGPARPEDAEPRQPSIEAHAPERSQWERHSLGPNIELHVRRPLSRLEQRRVERLITIARQVLKEDGV